MRLIASRSRAPSPSSALMCFDGAARKAGLAGRVNFSRPVVVSAVVLFQRGLAARCVIGAGLFV